MADSLTTLRGHAHPTEATQEHTGVSLSWLWIAAVSVLAVGALALRLYQIDGETLWLDEGYTLLFSGMSLPRLLVVGGAHEHPPLYYLIVHALRSIHESYYIPRYVSAVAGALSLPAIYALGSRIHSRASGLIAAVLLAIAPFHVWFSRDGRGYELAGLLVLLSYYCLFTSLDAPRRLNWLAYVLCTSLCLYAEYTTAFVLVPQVLLLTRAWKRGLARPTLSAGFLAVLLFLPWVTVLLVDAASIAGNYWIPPPSPSAWSNTVLEFLGFLTSCSAQPCTGTELGVPGLAGHEFVVTVAAAALATCTGLWAWWRRNLVVGVLCAWLIAPFVLVLLVSRVQSLFLDRVFLDATFPLYLLLGIGLASMWRYPVRVIPLMALTGVIIGGSLATLRPIYAFGTIPDWKTAMRDFHAAYRPGQAAVFYPGALRSLAAAYLPPGWRATTDVSLWSRTYLDVPGWNDEYPALHDPTPEQRSRIEATVRDRQLRAAASGTSGIWLITQDYSEVADTRHWFTTHEYTLLLSELYQNDARIEYWSRGTPAGFGRLVARLGDSHWQFRHPASRFGALVMTGDGGSATRAFNLHAGQVFSVNVEYRGPPQVVPQLGVLVYNPQGAQIAAFPATHWYDLPSNGAWVSNPFGFIAPPGAARALLYVASTGGVSEWRHIAVYRER